VVNLSDGEVTDRALLVHPLPLPLYLTHTHKHTHTHTHSSLHLLTRTYIHPSPRHTAGEAGGVACLPPAPA
jgi:hypothetical protein